ncbi:hypothetical protein J6590_001382 [Homalodisca vitripennis]|nr:hypothetical protein J6590_001382 [Homalodisca vitripennis]
MTSTPKSAVVGEIHYEFRLEYPIETVNTPIRSLVNYIFSKLPFYTLSLSGLEGERTAPMSTTLRCEGRLLGSGWYVTSAMDGLTSGIILLWLHNGFSTTGESRLGWKIEAVCPCDRSGGLFKVENSA